MGGPIFRASELRGVGPPGIEPGLTVGARDRTERTGPFFAGFRDQPADGRLHGGGSGAPDRTLRAAGGLRDLPAIPIDLFTRAAAIVAERAARGSATQDDVEAILARGLAQAREVGVGEGQP
jgi:hypothetical protein